MKSWKWWIVCLVGLVAAASVGVWMFSRPGTSMPVGGQSRPPGSSSPELLKPLTRATPVLGAKITVHDIAAQATDMGSRIGVAGNRLHMLSEGEGKSWVYTVDTSTGKLAYPPVEIGSDSAKCLQNGPGVVLCVASRLVLGRSESDKTAWVIDTTTGKITYQGSTDVDDYALDQVGQYAVGHTLNTGWWGIGGHGERTWNVAGSGSGSLADNHTPTLPAQRLAAGEIDKQHTVIFSVIDGHVVAQDGGAEPQVYPGGFVTVDAARTQARIYDETGTVLNTIDGPGENTVRWASTTSSEAVVLSVGPAPAQWRIFDRAGKQTAAFPEPSFGSSNNGVQVIGGHLFTREYGDNIKQYDPKTGAPVNECDKFQVLDITGTDGTVFLLAPYGQDAQAVDISTCQVLWTLPAKDRVLIKVNDTIVVNDYRNDLAVLKPV